MQKNTVIQFMQKNKKTILIIAIIAIIIIISLIIKHITTNNSNVGDDLNNDATSNYNEVLGQEDKDTAVNEDVLEQEDDTDDAPEGDVIIEDVTGNNNPPPNSENNDIPSNDENYSSSEPILQAPNVWLHWQDHANDACTYDVITIDWRCIDDADGTYWAVHCWDFGYAGFQNDMLGNKVLLMSLWDLDDGTTPNIEYYSSDYDYGHFNHEGSGAYVFTPYEWKVGTWYSMKIEISYKDNSTYFTQYIKKENGKWNKTACISYPTHYELTCPPNSFQEDYIYNNLKRSCEVKNAGGRVMNTQQWTTWDACEIVTSYYPDPQNDPSICFDNITFDCNYEVDGSTIKMVSGGSEYEPNEKSYPVVIPLS